MVANGTPPAPRNGVIRNIRHLAPDVAGFDVRLSAPMTFEAGQFVVIEADGFPGGRAYSMVNFETEVDTIALVIKRKPGGSFSEWLFREGQKEPRVNVFGPLGRAVFRGDEGKNIVCIAGGSGIAGMMSILECASRNAYFRAHRGAVYFGVRTALDAFYLEPLSHYAATSHGNLDITVAFSHEAAAGPVHADFPGLKLARGMVHEVAGNAMDGRLGDALFYVAGPPVMVDATIRALVVGGVSSRDIRYDKFA
jgi:toluene monooxygenase electron transfer component